MPYRNDLVGKVFGRWVILKDLGMHYLGRYRRHYWEAQCECGVTREIEQGVLLRGNSQSCGCLKRDLNKAKLSHDYTGERIGRRLVLEQTEPMDQKRSDGRPLGKMRMWKVQCDCGTEGIIQTKTLKDQKKTGYGSCGCWRKELNRAEREKQTPPYSHYLMRIKNSAKNREIKVAITYEELLTLIPSNGIGKCNYCGTDVIWLPFDRKRIAATPNHNRATGHNLDRKNNLGGYSIENVVICCGNCNRTKGDRFSYDEFMLLSPILQKIRENRQK